MEVYVFDRRSLMVASLAFSSEGLDITYPYDEAYITFHEAWTGIPRIHVCTEDLERLPSGIFEAALRHEAAHSVLHGSPEYYILRVPAGLAEKFREKGFTDEEIKRLAYLEAVALKDFEVSSLLERLGFREDQENFLLHVLRLEGLERDLWKLASSSLKTRLFYLAHLFKLQAAATPYLKKPTTSRLEEAVKKAFSHLDDAALKFLRELQEALTGAEGDFHSKLLSLLKATLEFLFPEG
ncbi:hypothetical protein DRO53_03865 [Candidatus Bathyarchaeota archaeon]|nr:MAG: hypothetical protein DRO53_03865 [Candidatus Bathyarchaeota archaeon]